MDTDKDNRNIVAAGIGLAFISVGVDHFISPCWYEPIVPSMLADPRFWVLASGVFEILFGLLLIIPNTRAWASVGWHGCYWSYCIGLISTCGTMIFLWSGKTYDDFWHVVRFVIQIVLILGSYLDWRSDTVQGQRKGCTTHSTSSRVESLRARFETGDRIVVGAWKNPILW